MKLYYYRHCPFCIRIQLVIGFLGLNSDIDEITLEYADEIKPVELTGKKLLPILVNQDNKAINESLDIISFLDKKEKLGSPEIIQKYANSTEPLIHQIGKAVHPLAMPYWVYSKEFNEESRNYFIQKKEKSKGPFDHLIRDKSLYLEKLGPIYKKLESWLESRDNKKFDLEDILITSHLLGLYVVPEIQLPSFLHNYLQEVTSACKYSYSQSLWGKR